jgi:hypothetical protein
MSLFSPIANGSASSSLINGGKPFGVGTTPTLAQDTYGVFQSVQGFEQKLANAIITPKGMDGIGGFVFDYKGDETAERRVDVTDHWLEDNSPAQDHAAVAPLRLILRGYVGELAVGAQVGLPGALGAINDKLSTLPAYLGNHTPAITKKISQTITKAQNVLTTVDQTIAQYKNVVGFFLPPGLTKQQRAFQTLDALATSKTLVSVVTPFGMFNNMLIESISMVQHEDSISVSDITVRLKQIRFVKVAAAKVNYKSSRNNIQSNVGNTVAGGPTGGSAQNPKTDGPFSFTNIVSTVKNAAVGFWNATKGVFSKH